jgi:hypothetical protein
MARSNRSSVLFLTLALLPLVRIAEAQTPGERVLEFTPFAGYQAGGGATSRQGQFSLDSSMSYGLMVDIRVRPDATLHAIWDRQDTVLDFRDNDPLFPRRVFLDVAVEYYHFGGTVEFPKERLRPYIVLTVGATRFDVKLGGDFGDEWRFSVGFGGGLKTYVSDRFGFRFDARVWPTFVNTSGGFFCSLPGACLVSFEADAIVQANATAGFFLAF